MLVLFFCMVLGAMPAFGADDIFGNPSSPDRRGVAGEPSDPSPRKKRLRCGMEPRKAPEPDRVAPNHPVIVATRESNPQTAEELILAIDTLLDIGARTEAKKYLIQLMASSESAPAKLIAVQQKLGSTIFLRIAHEKRLQPEGRKLADMTLTAASKWVRSPARIQKLIQRMKGADRASQLVTFQGLRSAGDAAINPLLEVLADPSRTAEHRDAQLALVAIGGAAVEPLIGVLDAPSPSQQVNAIKALGRLQAERALPYLVAPAVSPKENAQVQQAARKALMQLVGRTPSKAAAEKILLRDVRSFLAGTPPLAIDQEGKIELWHWDAQNNRTIGVRYPARDASLVVAARLASDLYALSPNNSEYRRLYLLANLEAAKKVVGLDSELPKGPGTIRDRLGKEGTESLEKILTYAIRIDRIPAAIGAAEVLGDVANIGILMSPDGSPRPLVRALTHRNRRLRAAAANAIMQIDPRRTYPGSSQLVATLGYLAGTTGKRQVLVGHPISQQGQTLAGMLSELGLDAEIARTGRDLFRKAAQNPDVEFVLISDAIARRVALETIQSFRRDPRTAGIPIGFMVRSKRIHVMQDWAKNDRLIEVFPQPADTQSLGFRIRCLLKRSKRDILTKEERIQRASRALKHLAKLAEHPQRYSFYDLSLQEGAIESALLVSELAKPAARTLGLLGSAKAQHALVLVASQNPRPLAQRQAAATGFALAVKKHGLLLTTQEIKRQYAIYNQSAKLDIATQKVLGSLLDTIEAPSKQKK